MRRISRDDLHVRLDAGPVALMEALPEPQSDAGLPFEGSRAVPRAV